MLTSLVGLTGYSLLKKNANEETCDVNPACNNCNKFSGCKKPQADKQRKDVEE